MKNFLPRIKQSLSRPGASKRTMVIVGSNLLILIIGFLLGAFFGEGLVNRGIPIKASDKPEINRLIQKVSRHFAINPTENPTVATVSDPNILRQQNALFYRDVEEGDKLIVWTDRAALYSVKQDKILAALVAPNLQAPWTPETTASGDQPAIGQTDLQSLKFEIRNGTGKPGAAQDLAQRLKDNGYTVATVGDAAKTYAETVIVPVSDAAKAATLDTLVPVVGGRVGETPAGEKAGRADILIILGTDQG